MPKWFMRTVAAIVAAACVATSAGAEQVPAPDLSGKFALKALLSVKDDYEKTETRIDGAAFSAVRVATVSYENGNPTWTCVEPFTLCGVDFADLGTASKAAAAAERLSSVSAKNARTAVTGADGIADFGDLDPGAYLVKQFYAEGAASGYEKVEPFIAYLPQWTDGKWERDVTAMPKTAPAKTGRAMGETEPVRKTTETPAGSETEADAKGKTEEPQGGGGGAETDGGNGQGARNGPKTGDATPVSETLAVMFLALAIALTAAGKLKGGRSKT